MKDLDKPCSLLISSGIALSTLLMANPIHALTFTGEIHGTWGTPLSSESTPRFTGVGTSNFTWGTASTIGTNPNQLSFQGESLAAQPGHLFKLGELTYFNGTILGSTGIDSVPLNLDVAFTDPSTFNQVFTIDFDIVTTPNIGTPDENADAIVPITLISEQSFSSNGEDYTLSLIGFSQDDGLTASEQFRVLEDARTTASLFGQIILAPPDVPERSRIPEPGAIAGLGAVAVMMITRHRNKTHSEVR